MSGRIGLWVGFGLVSVLLVLLMIQIDRQWQRLSDMTRIMQEQAEDIRRTRGLVRDLDQTVRGGQLLIGERTADARPPASAAPDAFERVRRAAAQPDHAAGDWLMLAFATGLRTITPLVSSDAYASEVQSYVIESLLTRDPDTLEWRGLLAEDWSVSEDGKTITFRLRRDVSFSDGAPLTARDVAFTFEFIMNEVIAAPRERAYLSRIERVTALDDHTVEFFFAEPYFNSLQLA
ncbi:MAG: ABC transporter substrate-binding protein, partial [Candidatus Competibacteraceae bacterium]